MKKQKLYKSRKKGQGIAIYMVLIMFTILTIQPSLKGQSVMRAASEQVSNVGPLKASLTSSSDLRDYKFYNPFVIRNVNPAGDQFGYNNSKNTLFFQIDRMGETHSIMKRFYIIFYNSEVDFVKATRITSGYDETYTVRNYEWMSAPDHSLVNALPSFSAGVKKQYMGFDLGVSDWSGLTEIEIKFSNPVNEDFMLTIMAVNPNHIRKLSEEVIQYFAAPARFLGRVLGESRYSNYVSFANFHFEYNAQQGGKSTTEPLVVEVINPATGRTWMDRNLGASRAAISRTDEQAYGDLYQWGRAADGHQLRTSGTTSTLSNSDTPGHGNFILSQTSSNDWRSPQNHDLWQGINGINNPCPAGYRLPTGAELNAEYLSWSNTNSAGAFASPLKLPMAGYRHGRNGSLRMVGSYGYYWSSTAIRYFSQNLGFLNRAAYMDGGDRTNGGSVRCIKD